MEHYFNNNKNIKKYINNYIYSLTVRGTYREKYNKDEQENLNFNLEYCIYCLTFVADKKKKLFFTLSFFLLLFCFLLKLLPFRNSPKKIFLRYL